MIQGLISTFILLVLSILLITQSSFFRNSSVSKKWVLFSYGLKILTTLFLWWLYTFYYSDRSTADIYKYFDDANAFYKATINNTDLRVHLLIPFQERNERMQAALQNTQHWDLQSSFLINDNRTLIRLHFLLLYLSGGFFFFHQLFFSTLSFIGLFYLFRMFEKYTDYRSKLVFITTLLFPSTLLWTSGALKEAWLFFNLGFFLFHFEQMIESKSLKSMALVFLFFFLLIGIKIYVLLALVPSLLIFILIKKTKLKKSHSTFIISAFILFLGFLFREDLYRQLQYKQDAFIDLAQKSQAGSFYEIPKIKQPFDMVYYIPKALYNSLLRPLIPPNISTFSLISSLEQLALILILALAFIFPEKKEIEGYKLYYIFIPFVILLALIIGYTVPVVGAIVRYRIVFMPFLLFTLLTFVDFKKIPILNRTL